MVQMLSLDEVIEWCNRFAKIIGEDLEIDVRPAGETKEPAQAGQ